MWGGNTSGTPPTSVVTTRRPQHAASKIAMQNDSVREVFRKMWPLHKAFLTSECLRAPKSSTLPSRPFLSTNYFKTTILGPSPPIIKFTCLNCLQIFGMRPIKRSTPFLYISLETNTTLIVSPFRLLRSGSGKNRCESTAFGILKLALGLNLTLRQKFSLQAWETHMAASRSRKAHLTSLFRLIPAASW